MKPATELLADMRKHGIQMALVVDEHGALVGLVTLEDLVEVIVGEIRDEHAEEGDLAWPGTASRASVSRRHRLPCSPRSRRSIAGDKTGVISSNHGHTAVITGA